MLKFFLTIIVLLFSGLLLVFITGKANLGLHWQTANRESANIAPKPNVFKDAVVEVYSARTFDWRGLFAVHTWIAVKQKNAENYTIYQVIGWRSFWGLPVLSIAKDLPDRYWFGQKPQLIKSLYGDKAEILIPELDKIAREYPYQKKYVFWPGPNSNTFIAYIARNIPELELALPPNAIGKDYLIDNEKTRFFMRAPSNTGYQFSFYGVLGITVAKREGLEVNILSLVFGINPLNYSISLPGIGEIVLLKASNKFDK